MQLVASPGAFSDGYAVCTEKVSERRRRRPAWILFSNHEPEVIADHLVYGCVAVQSHFSRRPQKIFVQGKGQILCHRISVARIMCRSSWSVRRTTSSSSYS